MKILITGADGFVGKNLTAALRNIAEGKDRTRPEIQIDAIFSYDIGTPPELLEEFCEKADFVYHLAGVNRSDSAQAYREGNVDLTARLLELLKQKKNTCPVMLSGSIQASLIGRYDGIYGRSKKEGEDLFFAYARETGARVLVYRFPNLFGKWCRPNYNSAVATFCFNAAHGQPFTVHDPNTELELLYIDDLIRELLDALGGKEHRCEFAGISAIPQKTGKYCFAPVTHRVTLGEIAKLLEEFKAQPRTLEMPKIPKNSFAKKLYSTYISYLPKEQAAVALTGSSDLRGSFTELIKTEDCGQVSVNRIRPGCTKGQHWHHTKWEIFIVVAGEGLIRQRKIETGEVMEFKVSGEKPEAVYMLPGYTHSITNLSDSADLVTVMWANEKFDPSAPDTFSETV